MNKMNSVVNTKRKYIAPYTKIQELPPMNILAGSNLRFHEEEVDNSQKHDDIPEWGVQI